MRFRYHELFRRLSSLVKQSRRVEADLVAHIAEVDSRRLPDTHVELTMR
jgi:hypothetical protein